MLDGSRGLFIATRMGTAEFNVSDKLHWPMGGAPASGKVYACVHSWSPDLSWGCELGWTEVALPGAGPDCTHGGKNHRSWHLCLEHHRAAMPRRECVKEGPLW